MGADLEEPAAGEASTVNQPKKKGKARGLRHDRDCFTCKERKIKCDLNRPSCTRCTDAGLVCGGYPARIIWMQGMTNPNSSNMTFARDSNSDISRIDKDENMEDVVAAAVDGTKKRAISSKARRKSVPVISRYDQKKSPDEWISNPEEKQSKKHKSNTVQNSVRSGQFSANPGSEEAIGYLVESVETEGNTHFLWGVKAIVTAFNHARETGARSMLVPGVKSEIEQSQVLGTIWKFVSTFLNNGHSDNQDFEYQSLQLKVTALQELKGYINQGILEAVFAVLAFTYFDVCQGSFGAWTYHLRGARSILDIHCPDEKSLRSKAKELPGLDHAITLLAWYDVNGALATRDRPLIFSDWHRASMDDQFFKVMGCPVETFNMLADVANQQLSVPKQRAPPSFIQPLNAVLSMPHAGRTFEQCVSDGWKFTCLLSSIAKYGSGSCPVRKTLVARICQCITALPQDSGFSQHLAVPVFVAGIHAVEQEHRQVITKYWKYWRSSKFPLYPDALEQCEKRWMMHDEHK